jgi:hypothetical protein
MNVLGAGAIDVHADDQTRNGDYERPVAGTVRLMTDEPLEWTDDEHGPVRERVAEIVNRRPWILPAALLALGAAFLLFRRRR